VGTCNFTLDDVFTAAGTHWDGIDVTDPHTDVLASRAFRSGDDAIIQAFFAATPFEFGYPDYFDVLFDSDGNPSTGQPKGDYQGNTWNYDAMVAVNYDESLQLAVASGAELLIDNQKQVVQLRVPFGTISSDGQIRYALLSSTGSGAVDVQPNQGGQFLGGATVSDDQVCTPD
jgi:hypothetical protein